MYNIISYMLVIGLGNPGEQYVGTRHNIGRDTLRKLAEFFEFDAFATNKPKTALVTNGKLSKQKTQLLLPETFMNKSGNALPSVSAKKLIVLHDDLDLPLGKIKISQGRSAGGHRGVESIIKKMKSNNFTRIRIGVSLKKKISSKKVNQFILGKFTPAEQKILKKTEKQLLELLPVLITQGPQKAMNLFN